MRWDIFCTVVDNYGDIGVCWRLARNLAHDHAQTVRLWVDDLHSFARLCPGLDPQLAEQIVEGITVCHWPADFPITPPEVIGDAVIEAFACNLPQRWIAAMHTRKQQGTPPAWFNLEYLSAESWVEDCHGLPSTHAQTGLRKTFFFPGFTPKTGGLIREPWLAERRQAFLETGADWRTAYGLPAQTLPTGTLQISLFSYENDALPSLLAAWQQSAQPIVCYVPEGRALAQLNQVLGLSLTPRQTAQLGALRIEALPFVSQNAYDALLWACDINFVRGEDSLVRAIWAQKPFVWQLYPQAEAAHLEKLAAFLQHYLEGTSVTQIYAPLGQAWNLQTSSTTVWFQLWRNWQTALPALQSHAHAWAEDLASQANLSSKLLAEATELHQIAP